MYVATAVFRLVLIYPKNAGLTIHVAFHVFGAVWVPSDGHLSTLAAHMIRNAHMPFCFGGRRD